MNKKFFQQIGAKVIGVSRSGLLDRFPFVLFVVKPVFPNLLGGLMPRRSPKAWFSDSEQRLKRFAACGTV